VIPTGWYPPEQPTLPAVASKVKHVICFHAIAEQLVDLDTFGCSGDASMDGRRAGHRSRRNHRVTSHR
jgi:hypothetical protein